MNRNIEDLLLKANWPVSMLRPVIVAKLEEIICAVAEDCCKVAIESSQADKAVWRPESPPLEWILAAIRLKYGLKP